MCALTILGYSMYNCPCFCMNLYVLVVCTENLSVHIHHTTMKFVLVTCLHVQSLFYIMLMFQVNLQQPNNVYRSYKNLYDLTFYLCNFHDHFPNDSVQLNLSWQQDNCLADLFSCKKLGNIAITSWYTCNPRHQKM